MKIFITGTNGFVGGHLKTYLQSRGYTVISVVSSCPKHRSPQTLTIEEFINKSHKNLLQIDENFVFIHAGWAGVFGHCRNNSGQLKNIEITSKLFDKCLNLGCIQFIFFGTQAEYATSDKILTEVSPLGPESLYGFAKDACRKLLALQNSLADKHCCVTHLRLFDVYGPGDDESWVLPTIISRLRLGKEVRLTSGNQIWNYIHVLDVCSAVSHLIDQRLSGVFNLCGDENLPLRDYFIMAAKYFDAESLLLFGEIKHHSEGRSIFGSNRKLSDSSGWQPKYRFCDGLKEMLGDRD